MKCKVKPLSDMELRKAKPTVSGTMSGYRDCHIESDWILIYRVDDDAIVFERTGTLSDIFK